MAQPTRILIAGGYGVFGQLITRELLRGTDAELLIAGRDRLKAEAFCRSLNAEPRVVPLKLDLSDLNAVQQEAARSLAVVCTAGPFQALSLSLPRVVVEAGAHWVDIGDPKRWVLGLLENLKLKEAAVSKNVSVVPGLSTVPAVSGILARCVRDRARAAHLIRLTLWVGNRNAKSAAIIATVLATRFGNPLLVKLPQGRRWAYAIDSPCEVLLLRELGVPGEFRVAFEWRAVNHLLAIAQPVVQRWSARTRWRVAEWTSRAFEPLSQLGDDGWLMQAEAVQDGKVEAVARLSGRGQAIAVLPCAIALEALISGELHQPGCVSPATWLSPRNWVDRFRARGIEFSEFAAGGEQLALNVDN